MRYLCRWHGPTSKAVDYSLGLLARTGSFLRICYIFFPWRRRHFTFFDNLHCSTLGNSSESLHSLFHIIRTLLLARSPDTQDNVWWVISIQIPFCSCTAAWKTHLAHLMILRHSLSKAEDSKRVSVIIGSEANMYFHI